jgi:hypothetical protein
MDPTLGVPLPEKSYGDACELTYDNIVVSGPVPFLDAGKSVGKNHDEENSRRERKHIDRKE